MSQYEQFVLRNNGIIDQKTQKMIQDVRIIIAGCGLGSIIAETCLRLGFINIILVDGDTVSDHNLNRQNFIHQDLGILKTKGIEDRLKSIYPNANIIVIPIMINKNNVEEIVNQGDIIIDTIDFVDLRAIEVLHNECNFQNKKIISLFSIGMGSIGMVYNPNGKLESELAVLLKLPQDPEIKDYVKYIAPFVDKMFSKIGKSHLENISKSIQYMEDGTPCPAPQIAVGAFSTGALCGEILLKIMNNQIEDQIEFFIMESKRIKNEQ